MKKKKRLVAIMLVASILTFNVFPVNAAGTIDASLKGVDVLQDDKDGGMFNNEKISKSKFLDEVRSIKAEFPEANLNVQTAVEEYDAAIKKQSSQKMEDFISDFVKTPKEVYSKVKDDGSTLTLKVYSASSWETISVTPGSRSGNNYTGTKCEVRHVNDCTTLGVSFKVDHITSSTKNYVNKTYSLYVIGFPDFATGLGVSVYRGTGPYAKIYVTGHDLTSGMQLFHGMLVFHPEDFSLYTSYTWD